MTSQSGRGSMILNVAINNLGGGGGGNVPPVANFTFTTSGLTANFTDTSTDSDGTIASRSWTFGDGGTSTATNPSHTYAANGTYTVTLTVTDNGGAQNAHSAPVTVSSGGGGGTQLLGNTGFENGTATAPWTLSSGVINNSTSEPPHAGSWDAWMDGYGRTHTDTSSQTVTIPAGHTSATLQYYLHIDTAETTTIDRVRHAEGAGHQHVRHGARDAGDVVEPQPRQRLCRAYEQHDAVHRPDRGAQVHRHGRRVAADVVRAR